MWEAFLKQPSSVRAALLDDAFRRAQRHSQASYKCRGCGAPTAWSDDEGETKCFDYPKCQPPGCGGEGPASV